jgi:hypothetical protein
MVKSWILKPSLFQMQLVPLHRGDTGRNGGAAAQHTVPWPMLGQGPAWSDRPLPGGGALPFGAYLGRSEGYEGRVGCHFSRYFAVKTAVDD